MRWVILSVRGMPEGQSIAVVYGSVDEMRAMPHGVGTDIPEEAWQGIRREILSEEQADFLLDLERETEGEDNG